MQRRIRASRVMDVLGRAGLLDLDKDEKERLKNQEEQEGCGGSSEKVHIETRAEMSKAEQKRKKKLEKDRKWWEETGRRDVEEFESHQSEILKQDNVTAYETRILREDISVNAESKRTEVYAELKDKVAADAESEMNRTKRDVDAEMEL